SRFGTICGAQMVSDLALISVNTAWCLSIDVSHKSRGALFFGVISKSLYFFTCKLHVLMAINRFSSIRAVSGKEWQRCTVAGAVGVCGALAVAQSISGPLLDANLYVVFTRATMRFQFAQTPRTAFYEAYLEYYVVIAECSTIIILDAITLIKLHALNKHAKGRYNGAAREVRLLKQSFCQIIPGAGVMIFFFLIAPQMESLWYSFLTSTFAWHFGIGLDG
ncbi:hypothetical protein PFISCL1PPCAC_12983, partial [Pristionchus fissidentatus]